MGGLVFVLRGIQQMPLLQPPHHCSLTRSQAPRILLRGVLQESCPFLVCKSWKLFHKNLEEGMKRIKSGLKKLLSVVSFIKMMIRLGCDLT